MGLTDCVKAGWRRITYTCLDGVTTCQFYFLPGGRYFRCSDGYMHFIDRYYDVSSGGISQYGHINPTPITDGKTGSKFVVSSDGAVAQYNSSNVLQLLTYIPTNYVDNSADVSLSLLSMAKDGFEPSYFQYGPCAASSALDATASLSLVPTGSQSIGVIAFVALIAIIAVFIVSK